jgi:hypothetical protein
LSDLRFAAALRYRTITRSLTGSLKIPVLTVFPFQVTSRGSPTLREMSFIFSSKVLDCIQLRQPTWDIEKMNKLFIGVLD